MSLRLYKKYIMIYYALDHQDINRKILEYTP